LGFFTWRKNIPVERNDLMEVIQRLDTLSIPMPGPVQHTIGEVMNGYSLGMSILLLILSFSFWSYRHLQKNQRSLLSGCLLAITLVSWFHFFIVPSIFLTIAVCLVLYDWVVDRE